MSGIYILADHREFPSGVIEALCALPDVTVALETLDLADYHLTPTKFRATKFMFERKTLRDLVASIKDGRIFEQACRLAAAAAAGDRAAIILEGTAADLGGTGMRREAIQGVLTKITLFLGIPLLRSPNPEETARLMVYAGRQAEQLASTPGPIRHFAAGRPKGKRKVQLHILQGIPGIGPAKAKALLDHFGTIEAILAAEPKALADAEGVGPKTAETIRWAVSEAIPPY